MGRSRRERQKACDRCGDSAAVLYRIRTGEPIGDESPNNASPSDKPASDKPPSGDPTAWRFLCDRCLPSAQAAPGYVYGGTWKAQKSG